MLVFIRWTFESEFLFVPGRILDEARPSKSWLPSWACSFANSHAFEKPGSCLFILEVGDSSREQRLGSAHFWDWALQWRSDDLRSRHGNCYLGLWALVSRWCIWWGHQHQMGHLLRRKGRKERDIPIAQPQWRDEDQDHTMGQCQQCHSKVWLVLLNWWCHFLLRVDGRFGNRCWYQRSHLWLDVTLNIREE